MPIKIYFKLSEHFFKLYKHFFLWTFFQKCMIISSKCHDTFLIEIKNLSYETIFFTFFLIFYSNVTNMFFESGNVSIKCDLHFFNGAKNVFTTIFTLFTHFKKHIHFFETRQHIFSVTIYFFESYQHLPKLWQQFFLLC